MGSGGPKEPCVRWRSRSPHANGQFVVERTCMGMPNDTVMICAKMAEEIEMLFWFVDLGGPKDARIK